MMIIKRKQLIIAGVAMLLFLVGVLQIVFGGKNQVNNSPDSTSEMVDNTQQDNTSSMIYADAVSDSESNQEIVANADSANADLNSLANLFAYEKTERTSLRQDRQKALDKITEDQTADENSKAQAYESKMDLAELTEKEKSLETMVMSCGYDDCIVYFFEDGSIDVYVAATSMSGIEATKIADMVARNAGTTLDNVYIKTKF